MQQIAMDFRQPQFDARSCFLATEEDYDTIKALLQLSSFTNIINADDVFADPLVTINLYHSEFDRLVPANNTRDFHDTLDGSVTVNLR